MQNFWRHLSKPFLVLAPMDDVTDVVFREIVAQYLPKPDVFFTEFASADGLCSKGKDMVARKLMFTEKQHPVVAQIWGKTPEHFYEAAKLIESLKFDGIDINMGCPVEAVVKKGAGAALAANHALAKEIIEATKKGAPNVPLSIKTRLGLDKVVTEEWVTFLLQQNITALAIHGRIAIQMSKGEADWDEIGKAVKIRNEIAPETIIIGNGDIKTFAQAEEMHKKHGVDGVMIGRGIFNNPWVFEKTLTPNAHKKDEYIHLLLKHVQLYDEVWGKKKNFEMLKKFFKMYVKDFDMASELRQKLMLCKTSPQVQAVIQEDL